MAYNNDPLQKVLNKRFQRDGDRIFFVCAGLAGRLPVSEDDVIAAEEELRYQSGKAKAVNLVIFGSGSVALYFALLHGFSMFVVTIGVLVAALAAGIGFNLVAIELVIRPFKARLREYQKDQPGWQPKGFVRALRDLGISPAIVGISFAIALFLAVSALNDLRLRDAVLDHGTRIEGRVIRSYLDHKTICRGYYQYNWENITYAGEWVGCELMKSHPSGSSIKISISAEQPEYSIVQDFRLWTGDIISRLIPFAILAISLCLVARTGRSYAPPSDGAGN